MNNLESDSLTRLLGDLESLGVKSLELDTGLSVPAHIYAIDAAGWSKAAGIARRDHWRWAGVWAEELGDEFRVYCCLEQQGQYLILHCLLPAAQPHLPSQAHFYWAADRPERAIRDMFGIRFDNHPDKRRWIRHQAWDEQFYPLRRDFPVAGNRTKSTPPDKDYPFLKAHGASVYEIPVGPIHAGIIEPGHFRFLAVGETVLHLEERLGYVHKGIEKIAEGREPESLARLAGRVSGDTTVGHTWAACMAMERAAGLEIPGRAAFIRGILAERERVINHLWDMAALCNDVAFSFAFFQFGRLREVWLRENQTYFGHRLLMDRIILGGVHTDVSPQAIAQFRATINALRRELDELLSIVDDNSSLEDRFLAAGFFSPELADALGALGYVGRASGQSFDVRKDAPYAPYTELNMRVALEEQGDVASRFWVRYKELRIGLSLLEEMMDKIPAGELCAPWRVPAAEAAGFAVVEGWRGEILCFVRFGADNKISRYWPRDPSVINWPALEKLTLGNIVPDFPVCNKSVNGSYSGHDL
ncbi:MAG: NADH-quinone oxidoreductase subunit C [Methylomonas sp.]|jgi:Ni,Fe-hydrogenase III large subunit